MEPDQTKTPNIFTRHPLSIGETYLQHCKIASFSGIRLVFAGLACLIHSIFPFLFINTASDAVQKIALEMAERKNKRT